MAPINPFAPPPTPDNAAFLSSRIFAQGWNAARTGGSAARNPYPSDPEKARWAEGFDKASL